MLTTPDLLYREPFLGIDREALGELFGLAILGKEIGTEFHDTLAATAVPEDCWRPEFFADDLFLDRLVLESFSLEIDGVKYPVNHGYLGRILGHAPRSLETVRFRQGIVRELDESAELLSQTEALYRDLFGLLSLHKTPGYRSSIDISSHHLDVLKQSKKVIDRMDEGFASAHSGLKRLHDGAADMKLSDEYRTLEALLDYEKNLARLDLDVTIGGDGKIRNVAVRKLRENDGNRFHRAPPKRFVDRLRLAFNGYSMSNRELLNRLIEEVYRQLSPSLIPLVQLLGHLEFYLTARTFRDVAKARGLETCLPEVCATTDPSPPLDLDGVFNPLLLRQDPCPVPCDIRTTVEEPITVVTGPNSGGKTRLLQAIALTQLLAQSGLYVPCRRARVRLQNGLFVSLIERESADQMEGRLGRELVRIRSLFEEMEHGSMVVLDELCSGTNPSEGIEVFTLVLQLLEQVRPAAYLTTHFLDYARSLKAAAPAPSEPEKPNGNGSSGLRQLEFLQVELDPKQRSTYQFVPGVADTSLAALTAERLGVTFERLSKAIES